jgi:glycosyltransferase involved in cell wall biosynthesis
MYEMSPEDRRELGRKGRAHVVKNYNFESIVKRWPELIKEVHKKYGSWDTRKGYALWELKEV